MRAEVRASIDEHNTIKLEAQHVRRLRLLLRPDLFAQPGNIKVVLNGKTVFEGALAERLRSCTRARSPTTGDPYLAYTAAMTFDVPK